MLKKLKTKLITGLLAAVVISAHGSLFVFSGPFTDGGVISPGGTSLADPQAISGLDVSIASFTLALTFNNNDALAGDGTGIQGLLTLGLTGGSPFVSFNPVDPGYTGGNATYDITFSGLPGGPGSGFNGLNPNDTWSLVLWDNNLTVGNELVSWSLDITAVPEPVNVALGVFGAVFAIGAAVRYFCQGNFRLAEQLNKPETAVETARRKM
jgi:hypothetical protein